MKKYLYRGFTLLELMVVVAILAIILTLAVPSYRETMRNAEMRNALQDWQSAFYFAQAEAMRIRREVTLCGSSDQQNCGGTGFEQGWIVFSTNSNGDKNIAKIRSEIKGNNITMKLNGNSPNTIKFKPNGNIVGFVGATLTVEYKQGGTQASRNLVISREGRMRLGTESQTTNTEANNRW